MVHNLDVEPKRKKQNVRSNNSSGYRGVSRYANGNKFRVSISIDGTRTRINGFNTALEAALAYSSRNQAGKKKSTLNFPDGLPIKQESDIDDSEGFWV